MKYIVYVLTFCMLLTGCSGNAAATPERSRSSNGGAMPGLLQAPGELTVIAADTDECGSECLGCFSTEFNAKNKRRSSNIQRASDTINETVIEPGETFSYNETVGPTSRKNGYKLSTIFIRGKEYEGYGGGVCQVSSTLYNAAANAGMTIVERHDHSMEVPYVETGKDAATSYGGIDFKFENNKPFPVMIKSHVEGGTITVEINAV